MSSYQQEDPQRQTSTSIQRLLLQAQQEMDRVLQEVSYQQQQQQQQQAVQGIQQAQAQQQAARPMVVWSGIMELTEVVRFSCLSISQSCLRAI